MEELSNWSLTRLESGRYLIGHARSNRVSSAIFGSIGHGASPPRSKRDSVKALAGPTPVASAKFGEVRHVESRPVLKTDVPSGTARSTRVLSSMLWVYWGNWLPYLAVTQTLLASIGGSNPSAPTITLLYNLSVITPSGLFERIDDGMCGICPGRLLFVTMETREAPCPEWIKEEVIKGGRIPVDPIIVTSYFYRCIACGHEVMSTELLEKALTN